jgi:hypothetical protein
MTGIEVAAMLFAENPPAGGIDTDEIEDGLEEICEDGFEAEDLDDEAAERWEEFEMDPEAFVQSYDDDGDVRLSALQRFEVAYSDWTDEDDSDALDDLMGDLGSVEKAPEPDVASDPGSVGDTDPVSQPSGFTFGGIGGPPGKQSQVDEDDQEKGKSAEQAKQAWTLRHKPPPYHEWVHANISSEAREWRLAIEKQFKILRQTSKTPAEHESARKEIARIKEEGHKYKHGHFGPSVHYKNLGGFIVAMINALQKGVLLGNLQYRAHYVTGKIPEMPKTT